MPYIEGAMEHINNIYEWNKQVDEMRAKALGISSIDDYYTFGTYNFKNGLRLYYEERGEYTTGKLEDNILDQVDALIDQFVVAVGEIRKCALADDYEHIEFWEDKARMAYDDLSRSIEDYIYHQYIEDIEADNIKEYPSISNLQQQALTEVIDALFTRFGDDAYIDENGKFIKSKSFREPNLSFLLK